MCTSLHTDRCENHAHCGKFTVDPAIAPSRVLPTAAPTAMSPWTELAGPNGPAGDTSIGVELGLDAIAATSRAGRRTDPGEPRTSAGSGRRGLLGRLAAEPDARLGDAGPRSRVGARRPRPPVRLVRTCETGATGVPERRPHRGRTATTVSPNGAGPARARDHRAGRQSTTSPNAACSFSGRRHVPSGLLERDSVLG